MGPELLSPDPTREVILSHSQNSQITQPVRNNNTTIQEEWIIPDKILPDETWNPTQSKHDINLAHKCKSILKTTTLITSNIIDHSQKKAYHTASHLAQQLAYKPSKSVTNTPSNTHTHTHTKKQKTKIHTHTPIH